MNLSEIKIAVKRELHEDISDAYEGTFSDAEIINAINQGYIQLVNIIPSETDIDRLIGEETYSAVPCVLPSDYNKSVYVDLNGVLASKLNAAESALKYNTFYSGSSNGPVVIYSGSSFTFTHSVTGAPSITLKYIKNPAVLSGDDDEPEIKESLHDLIVQAAIIRLKMKIHELDESGAYYIQWKRAVYGYYGLVPPEDQKK